MAHTLDLFRDAAPDMRHEQLAAGAWLLRGFALDLAGALMAGVEEVAAAAPFRHLITPGGFRMSVAMTNCGNLGWVSDARGYRYDACDPSSGRPWPSMPTPFLELAQSAAAAAGYPEFAPEACLINSYQAGARLTPHQDRDEGDLGAPIVSVSLGLPAIFLFGGKSREHRQQRVPLRHGDVVVWGGPSRLNYHGVLAIKGGYHEALGSRRVNLTFRRVQPF